MLSNNKQIKTWHERKNILRHYFLETKIIQNSLKIHATHEYNMIY